MKTLDDWKAEFWASVPWRTRTITRISGTWQRLPWVKPRVIARYPKPWKFK